MCAVGLCYLALPRAISTCGFRLTRGHARVRGCRPARSRDSESKKLEILEYLLVAVISNIIECCVSETGGRAEFVKLILIQSDSAIFGI